MPQRLIFSLEKEFLETKFLSKCLEEAIKAESGQSAFFKLCFVNWAFCL